jgi:hypothetical protein
MTSKYMKLKVKSYIQTQEGVYARRDCKNCEGTGTTYISDGQDDVDGEACNCVKYND